MKIINSIVNKLNRFTLESKLELSYFLSKNIMGELGTYKRHNHTSTTLPWNIECFALLSLVYDESTGTESILDYKGMLEMLSIFDDINGLMNSEIKSTEKLSFMDNFLPYIGTLEFKSQENYLYNLYRCSYFFSYKNETFNFEKIFNEKMGPNYIKFRDFGVLISLIVEKSIYDSRVITYINEKYIQQINKLVVTHEDVKKHYLYQSNYNFLNSVKVMWKTPYIIVKEKVHLVLPHLIYRAISDSMVFRITDSDKHLREMFGKHCLEDYIIHLLDSTNKFDEIKHEISYNSPKGVKHSSDVMARSKKTVLFVESKSLVPSEKIRFLNEESILYSALNIGKAVSQLYIQLFHEFENNYNPFSCEILEKFGLVVLLEDPFIRREQIYNNAITILKNKGIEVDIYKLKRNIKVIDLYQIESAVFEGTDILDSFRNHFNLISEYDYVRLNNPGGNYSKSFMKFKKSIQNMINNNVVEFVDLGIIQTNKNVT